MAEQLLKGIRVIDFTDFLAGPYIKRYSTSMQTISYVLFWDGSNWK